jgi:hypothetical protein
MITPSDSASAPEHYAGVAVQPANIQAGNDEAAVSAAMAAANADAGAGVLYPRSERQAEAKALMESVQGFGVAGFDVDAGSAFGWPNNVEPGG